jgi:hypothetical protein
VYFCFEIAGKRTCIQIPVLIQRWPPDPDPGPFKLGGWVVSDPSPEPWAVDLQVLASIEALTSTLTKERATTKDALQRTVREAVNGLSRSLPQGTKVEFMEAKVAR